ncbi:DUF4184 family protein [Nonomuraea sp. NPDC046570]|uniref:DUF4184 family protein n=1 Tax=Nonomuraea sp. NPDC046570 TaxID=3155255 RepID=UPI0033C8FA38
MPFTPSHIAAVLPFITVPRLRRWLDPWALAIGTMVPDLPIFLPFLPDYSDWHSLRGVLTLDLVSVVVLLGVFHAVVREPLIALLPPGLAGRAATLTPSYRIVPVLLGGVLGSATHVLWDSFTHSHGPAFWGVSWLGASVFGVIRLFRLLQYVSSVVGLVLVVWWAVRGLSRLPAVPPPPWLRLPARVRHGVLAACAAASLLGAVVWPYLYPPAAKFGIAGLITKVGAGTLVGLCLVLACYATIWQFRRLVAVFEDA